MLRFRRLSRGLEKAYRGSDVVRRLQRFDGWMDRKSSGETDGKSYDHTQTVEEYYDLSSELMEFGWGESLHFAPLSPHENLEESKVRHQRLMIAKLDLRKGMNVIDVGCGIGGPMRRVVREADVRVVGVNTSEVQVDKAKSLNAEAGLDHMVDYLECSFMDMAAVADDTFDRGYAIESTCHAPDKVGAFTEIYRVLKPGALFWGQEMCMTDRYDPDDKRHRAIRRELMRGIALADIATTDQVDRDLAAAGFEVLEGIDRAVGENGQTIPWYQPMETPHKMVGGALYRIPLGRKALIRAFKVMEALRIFPKGSADVTRMLDRTAKAYVAGGKTGIFTPLYCFLARKPPGPSPSHGGDAILH